MNLPSVRKNHLDVLMPELAGDGPRVQQCRCVDLAEPSSSGIKTREMAVAAGPADYRWPL